MYLKEDLWKDIKAFVADESGVGVIEVVLILVVLIGLVIVFKGSKTIKATIPAFPHPIRRTLSGLLLKCSYHPCSYCQRTA